MEEKILREVQQGTNNYKVLKEEVGHKTLVLFNDKEYVAFAKNDFNDSFFWGHYFGEDYNKALEFYDGWDM